MTNDSPKNFLTSLRSNVKILAVAGGILFFLGLAAFFSGYFGAHDAIKKSDLALGAALLLSMGYPLLLHVQSLKKIAELEKRVASVELAKRAN